MTAYRLDKLDADIAELGAWYAETRGLSEYAHAALIAECDTPAPKDDTEERYPLPDSYQRPKFRIPPIPKKQSLWTPETQAKYNARVADLRERGYMTLREAAKFSKRTAAALLSDIADGFLKSEDAMGFVYRGSSKPRYFVRPDDISAYLAWCAAGRKHTDKYKSKSARAKSA